MKSRAAAAMVVSASLVLGLGLQSMVNAQEKEQQPVKQANPVVVIETSMGTMKAELWPDKASLTVSNFLAYVDAKFYDGTIFHRVIPSFMIQGGGFTADMQQKPTKAPVKNEAKSDVKNARATLAMARTAVIDSATSQFFINHKDNGFLDHRDATPAGFGYCVFGKLTGGLDVLDKIAGVATGQKGPMGDVPVEPVTIKSIRRADAK
jgi:cyclophilin family peptidyl-prolyl cis-trans isomerase